MYWLVMVMMASVFAMIGVELSVSAFIAPAVHKLEPAAMKEAAGWFASSMGKVMPFWYAGNLVLLVLLAWLERKSSDFPLLLAAAGLWLLIIVGTLVFLVPLNNRVAAGAPDWEEQYGTWCRRHLGRVVLLIVAGLLAASALVV